MKRLGGEVEYGYAEENVKIGDVIAIKTDSKYAQSDADTIAVGVAMEDIDADERGPIWVGRGIVWAKCATSQSVGQGLTAGASGAFAAGTEGTHHISAIIADDSYADTDYVQVMLLG